MPLTASGRLTATETIILSSVEVNAVLPENLGVGNEPVQDLKVEIFK